MTEKVGLAICAARSNRVANAVAGKNKWNLRTYAICVLVLVRRREALFGNVKTNVSEPGRRRPPFAVTPPESKMSNDAVRYAVMDTVLYCTVHTCTVKNGRSRRNGSCGGDPASQRGVSLARCLGASVARSMTLKSQESALNVEPALPPQKVGD